MTICSIHSYYARFCYTVWETFINICHPVIPSPNAPLTKQIGWFTITMPVCVQETFSLYVVYLKHHFIQYITAGPNNHVPVWKLWSADLTERPLNHLDSQPLSKYETESVFKTKFELDGRTWVLAPFLTPKPVARWLRNMEGPNVSHVSHFWLSGCQGKHSYLYLSSLKETSVIIKAYKNSQWRIKKMHHLKWGVLPVQDNIDAAG